MEWSIAPQVAKQTCATVDGTKRVVLKDIGLRNIEPWAII